MEASSSNSSNQNPKWKYHVFLSFRGEDTRNRFANHLYAALNENGILTFRDDEELRRGEDISQELAEAIKGSLFAIIILSPNYPFSIWCLNELQEILKSRKAFCRQAFPVFYDVVPSDVRDQKGGFANAFKKHEKRFGEDSIKVQKWREALREVADLFGWDSRNWGEPKLIKEIVGEICKNLQPILPSQDDKLVGIDSKINEVYSLLGINEMSDARFIGIWGMGGAGKTTLAREVHERIKSHFDASCFLQDVNQVSKREGLLELQKKLLSYLNVEGMKIKDLYNGRKIIRNLLCNKKILLILDDVSEISQLENLAGNRKWFGEGSRVIVTTRDKQLIKRYGNGAFVYVVGHLNPSESLQLFLEKAFNGDHPKEGYLELSKSVVEYTGGLPLALKVLGLFLCGRSIVEWKDALDMLKQDPHKDILKTLRLSYDGLEHSYQTIFLDIACFFVGWDRDYVTHILHMCGRNPTIGIEVLIEKSLVTYDDQRLGMHDLFQDMGKYIVSHESPNDACGCSRLWSKEDVVHVLAKNKENKAVQGIVLNLDEPYEAHWNLEAFSKICNLKILILRTSLHLSIGLNCLSDALRVLEWEEYPLESLPPNIQLNHLASLKLQHSKIKQLWSGIKFFQNLRFINLSHSEKLIQTPNIAGVPNLETLILEGCINLVQVHQSIQQHKKLAILDLKDCLNLKILPNKLEMNSLENFILRGCSKVKKLPEFSDNMECLSMLDLTDCKNLLCLPNTIRNLKSLKILKISGCSKFSKMPNNLNENEALEELDVSGTAIREVPSSIVHLKNLQKLYFGGCKGSPSNSWDLFFPNRWFQKSQNHPNPIVLMLPSISRMPMLRELDLMPMLRELDLSYCNIGDGSIVDLGCLSSLSKLNLSGNNFVDLPTHSIASLSRLRQLHVYDCAKLQSLPILPPSLEFLSVGHSASMDFVSYLQRVLDLCASPNHQKEHWASFSFWIPGCEVPTWFDNQNYRSKDFLISKFPKSYGYCESVVSIIVDIPDHCRSNKSWGIAVCVFLEYSERFSHGIWWNCKAPEDDYGSIDLCRGYQSIKLNYPSLFIDFLWSEDKEIKKNLTRDANQLELIFTSWGKTEGKLKCGCRLLWKDNVEMWSNALTEPKPIISNVEDCSHLQLTEIDFNMPCQQDGLEEDDVTLQNPRPSKRGKLH